MWQLRNDAQAKVEAAVKIFLPPCQNKCPIREDIQRTNVLISLLPQDPEAARAGVLQIGDHLHERNPFFTVCGYICGICERECNYRTKGGSIKRRLLKRFLSDTYTPYMKKRAALDIKQDGEKVAVIGGGPGGLMCAWEMAKRGHDVTIFDTNPKLGGALRYIPKYRLPEDVLDTAVESLVRIGGIKVVKDAKLEGDVISDLKAKGFKVFFVATGTPYPRPLTFGVDKVEWQGMEGVEYGLTLLDEAGRGLLPLDYYKGKRVVVIGGGNVAFDAARTAYRLGGQVTVVCLENDDKATKDGIPADVEEIEGAHQEGIKIVYSRGVRNIIAEKGKFKKIDCPKCTGVFDYKGFNPQFDCSDCQDVEGDVLLITIGQMWDRSLLQNSGLFDERGRLAVDPLTRRSMLRGEVFIGGDVRRIGFMVDAMAEGREAAQSMERYLRGMPMQRWGLRRETTGTPARSTFKAEPPVKWTSPDKRKNFDMFEIGFTLDEAREEAKRCLACGPCPACKACVSVGIQPELPAVQVDESLCSGCGVCVSACNYETAQLVETKEIVEGREVRTRLVSYTDPIKCKACGICVSACPSGARELVPDLSKMEKQNIGEEPGVVCFTCKFGYGYCGNGVGAGVKTFIPVACIGKVDSTDVLNAFKKGADGVLLLGCGEGDCHFQDGNEEARKRVYLLQKVLESFGIEKERVRVVTSFDPEGASVSKLVKEFKDKLTGLGPIRV